jgi:hypothetical protein
MKSYQLNQQEMGFDEWKALAQNDPATFEAKRRQCIEALIGSAPEEKRRRLRGLQWQIDQTRSLARTPMASCIAISNMMWDSLYQLNQHQRELAHAAPAKQSVRPAASVAATVLPFRARQS